MNVSFKFKWKITTVMDYIRESFVSDSATMNYEPKSVPKRETNSRTGVRKRLLVGIAYEWMDRQSC